MELDNLTCKPDPKRKPQEKTVTVIRSLKKSFGDNHVLKGIDLELYDGENLVILGKSGTGKSVLIKCMVGLLIPDDGDIDVLGYHVRQLNEKQLNELRLKVGFSFQGSALYDSMTVRENLEFPLIRNLGITSSKELDKRVMRALEDVGLAKSADVMPSELSGGMKKRIGIARTLILQPEIMLYDEPTAGLDPVTATEINDLILEVQEKYKTSSIVITHDISSARQVANRIIALFNGGVLCEGTFSELKEQEHPELAPFFNY